MFCQPKTIKMNRNSTNKLKGISVFYRKITYGIKSALILCALCGVATSFGQQRVITSITPLAAPAGSTVKITASKVDPTASKNIVYFGAAKATVTSVSGTTLDVVVPAGA